MNLKILIIDDDEVVVFIQKKLLAKNEISNNPMVFKSVSPALDFIASEDGNKEFLILLDINMPGMNGWDFLEELSKKPDKDRFHVIMVTSSVEQRDKEKASKYSMVREFLEKPITNECCKKMKDIPEISHFFVKV
ncbi:MAG: response regulator [Salegentibacter sp.]|uniref:CheY chemotaxis protein or a CheY-like REC (Receiver) domain n=1 Tax=Salegentibacter flavus TaxID=287099 RepID=A0A1I5BHM4_9FLAO|nr:MULTISPECIES: response regulator [Salegentibacter]MDR9457414.1 response regulator [Salegentibacter sp.]SFN74248.1 CheY chemotaxis protein or a CheY-like REC (receiver) domain [Salegentibacter flavus]